MKSTAVNTINYSGIVTLSRCIGNKKIKIAKIQNAGGTALFDFISNCLVGDFDLAKISRPTKIKLLSYSEDTNTLTSATPDFIFLRTKPEKVYDKTKGVVRYSFIVTRDVLESASNFNSIGLYTNAATNNDLLDYAAICMVNNINKSSISASSALVVDWELNISNNKDLI